MSDNFNNSNGLYDEDMDTINEPNIHGFTEKVKKSERIENNTKQTGKVHIADEVISVIAGTATLEVEGVAGTVAPGTVAPVTNEIYGILGKKNLGKGVKVTLDGSDVEIEINISIKFGEKIHEVSEMVQKKVKMAIETMTGLNVLAINVNVIGVKQIKGESEI